MIAQNSLLLLESIQDSRHFRLAKGRSNRQIIKTEVSYEIGWWILPICHNQKQY